MSDTEYMPRLAWVHTENPTVSIGIQDGAIELVAIDYKGLGRDVYMFTAPMGVVRWASLPQHRQDKFIEAIRQTLDAAVKGEKG